MTTAQHQIPDYTSDAAASYKAKIDGNAAVVARIAAAYQAYAAGTPNMTVKVAAGALLVGGAVVENAIQTTGTITAPVTNPRIDRVVIDAATGAVSVIAGAEAASPTAPALTTGKLPVAQVLLATSTTAITNSMITDERAVSAVLAGPATGSGLTMSTARLLGRTTASTGAVEEITVGAGLSLSGGALVATGNTLGTPAATTSGATVDLTDMVAGTKAFDVTFDAVSSNGSSGVMLQVGPSGGAVTTGYSSTIFGGQGDGSTSTSTAGLLVSRLGAASDALFGNAHFRLINSSTNTWSVSGIVGGRNGSGICWFAGSIALSGPLIKVRLATVNGTDTFDGGEANDLSMG